MRNRALMFKKVTVVLLIVMCFGVFTGCKDKEPNYEGDPIIGIFDGQAVEFEGVASNYEDFMGEKSRIEIKEDGTCILTTIKGEEKEETPGTWSKTETTYDFVFDSQRVGTYEDDVLLFETAEGKRIYYVRVGSDKVAVNVDDRPAWMKNLDESEEVKSKYLGDWKLVSVTNWKDNETNTEPSSKDGAIKFGEDNKLHFDIDSKDYHIELWYLADSTLGIYTDYADKGIYNFTIFDIEDGILKIEWQKDMGEAVYTFEFKKAE